MIGYIKGTLVDKQMEHILVENQGIGYLIFVPVSIIDELPELGSEVKIHTYLYVKEDQLSLYGFRQKDQMEIFKLLLTVNGIGPKAALGILSAITPDNLRFAILAEDAATIAKAPGIGKKTASKLILELKDKFSLDDALEQTFGETCLEDGDAGLPEETDEQGLTAKEKRRLRTEASEALIALGFSATSAHKAISKVELVPGMDVDDVLKLSLKNVM